MRLSIFGLISLLLLVATPAWAQSQEMHCSALDEAKSYKDKQSYKYLLVGSDGWVFRSKKDFKQSFLLTDETLKKFSALNKAFKNNGVILHIVMPPTRGLLHYDNLILGQEHDPIFDAQQSWQSYQQSIEQLKSIGISIASFDGAPDMKEEFYYKRDHHWTLSGAKFSVKKTAILFESFKDDITPASYKTEKTNETITLNGTFEEFVEKTCSIKIPNETTVAVKTYKDTDLFENDDSMASIALIGTSNCTEPNPSYANFAGYLREYIGADIDNVSIAGGGIDTPMLAYLASEDYKNKAHKHVIWELASHYDFNGNEFSPIFQQIIPAAKGRCGDNAFIKKEVALSAEKTDLSIIDISENSYMYLQFDSFIKKDFALSYKNSDGKAKRFRFKRSDRYPHDGTYDLNLNVNSISSMMLLMPKGHKANNVSIELCPVQ